MPVQQQTPSDIIRQKRLVIETNNNHVLRQGGVPYRLASAYPIKLTAINSNKFVQTPSQKNFSTGLSLSPITHVKMN